MKELVTYLQDLGALAFVLIGVAASIGWLRRRDGSLGYLALAIALLGFASLLGRVPALLHVTPPLLVEVSVVAFMGSGYSLLLYRNSLIPLPKRWHIAALIAIVGATALFLTARELAGAGVIGIGSETMTGIALVLVWSAAVGEPIIRFWLVARQLPAVQAWRLRSLSLGFAGIVALLLVAVVAGAIASNPVVEVAIQLAVLVIAPLLYASFSPPAWLRREWRAAEEHGLTVFMQDLLIREDRQVLADRALEWAMRLVGGAAALAVDGAGTLLAARGLDPVECRELQDRLPELPGGVSRTALGNSVRTVLILPIAGSSESDRWIVLAGPFTPRFGVDELSRVQQFMSAVGAALDRSRLITKLQDANRQLREANQHKSVFLASMSHELRTPLNAIIGFSELIIDAGDGQFDEPTRKRFVQQIHTSGKHLLGLINDILDLSKIEAGHMELRLEACTAADVIEQVVTTVEPLARQKRIQIDATAAGAGDVIADEGKLKQMLLNLVSNAIKFTPDGGLVKIEARRMTDCMDISVRDTGIGIADQDRARIFEEFRQLDSGVGRRQQGTGLGLTLTRRFARLHGGDVRVESEVDKGSVFTISLPLNAPGIDHGAALRDGTAVARQLESSRPLVLVVEDNPGAAELITRTLEGGGYRTAIARTGTAALAMAKELGPMAITLDILLPELDGWEVMSRLKREETTRDIPVVIVSVVDNPELGIALGALDYFVKPVEPAALLNSLNRFNLKRKSGLKDCRILVVDDDYANRDFLAGVLEPAGFTVITAKGGREAIKLARSGKADLVLLDLMMPEVTGFDVVDALRANETTRAIPIMVLTAKDLTEADKQQLNGQVSTVLSRHSTGATELLGRVNEVVGHASSTK